MPLTAPEILPEPIRPPRIQPEASPETFGGGAGLEQEGQQVQKIAQSGGEVAAFEKIRADQSAVEEAVGSKLSPALTKMLYDPDNGALARISQSTSMKDALKIHDDTLKQYNDTAKGIASKDLNGENQIGAFNRHAFEFGDNLNRTLMAHIDQHGREIDKGSFNSFVDNTISQAALGWGNADPKKNLGMLDEHATQYGFRTGMDAGQVDELKSKIHSNYHAQIIDRMLADGQSGIANKYFSDNKKDITNLDTRDDVEKNIATIPKQQAAQAKQAQEEKYKTNERQTMMDLLDGKLSLSEVQRRYRNDDIDKSTFDHVESKLSKPDLFEQAEISDPGVFNSIRQAQLNKSSTPNEILRMISDGVSDKKITPEDNKYLAKMTAEAPPSPRDKAIDAQANNIRDFGNRYLKQTNFLGVETGKNEKDKEVEGLVQDFYKSVDSSRATGEQIKDIRDQVKKMAMQKRFPGLGNYDKAPDVVVNVRGEVIKVLDPDSHSALKAKYHITPTPSQDVDQQ